MEIVNGNVATLSNFEVMKQLQEIKDTKRKNAKQGQLATITYETLRYLENSTCNQQTPSNIVACLKELEQYQLSKNEKLMIINTPPTTALEIQLIIDGSEERLTEEQVEEILKIAAKHFNLVQVKEEAADT